MNINNCSFQELKKYYDETLNTDRTTYKSSNDEPTPIGCVEEMINKIPDELWKRKNLRILDPCCGNGNFSIPIIASNRINSPEIADDVISDKCADLVSMARPFLADSEFVKKAFENKSNEIVPCIACNQACLDHTFSMKLTSCLVNPRACRETELNYNKVLTSKRIAVVGAGPAGISFSITAAQRGHVVSLFEESNEIGGQLNFAKIIPGKEEFHGLLNYYKNEIKRLNINLITDHKVKTTDLINFDEIIISTGVVPRKIDIEGQDKVNFVYDY